MAHRLPTPGSDNGSWGYVLNDFLSVSLDADGTILPAALSSVSGNSRVITAITGTITGAATAKTDYVYYWTGSTAYPFTMPTAVGNTNLYTLKNTSSVNQTILFTGGQTGDGSTNVVLTPNTALDLISNNANYMIV